MNLILSNAGAFFSLCFSAILVENAMLSRGLGTDRLLLVTDDIHHTLDFTVILTIITTISCGIAYWLDQLLLNFSYNYSFKPFFYVVALGGLYLLAHKIAKAKMKRYKKIEQTITVSVFNCAVLGSMLLVSLKSLTFFGALGFGLGTGLGYTLSLVFVSEGTRKMKKREMPTTFKGLPSMLLYIGILSMAVFALTGYQI